MSFIILLDNRQQDDFLLNTEVKKGFELERYSQSKLKKGYKVIRMNKRSKGNLKDPLWGVFWVGMAIVSARRMEKGEKSYFT